MRNRKPKQAKEQPPAVEGPAAKEIEPQAIIEKTLERCANLRLVNGERAFSPSLLELAKWHLERAASNCQTLDFSEGNKNAFFLTRFLAGIQTADAIGSIHAVVIYPMDGRADRQIKAARRLSTGKGRGAYALHYLRELVRDRFSPSEALFGIAREIQERLEAGDAEFFEKLGDELKAMRKNREKYQRSLEGWIRRAWLPLCLWQFSGAKDAWPLCYRAGNLNNLGGLVEAIQSSKKQWDAFERAW